MLVYDIEDKRDGDRVRLWSQADIAEDVRQAWPMPRDKFQTRVPGAPAEGQNRVNLFLCVCVCWYKKALPTSFLPHGAFLLESMTWVVPCYSGQFAIHLNFPKVVSLCEAKRKMISKYHKGSEHRGFIWLPAGRDSFCWDLPPFRNDLLLTAHLAIVGIALVATPWHNLSRSGYFQAVSQREVILILFNKCSRCLTKH